MSIKHLDAKGIGLIETITALGIAVVVITALVSLAVFTLRSSQTSKYLLEGSKLANEELELVRVAKETSTSWVSFLIDLQACDDSAADTCYIDTTSDVPIKAGIETLDPNPAVGLRRSFRAYDPTAANPANSIDTTDQIVRIEVRVMWNVGNDTKGAYSYTDISNWRGD